MGKARKAVKRSPWRPLAVLVGTVPVRPVPSPLARRFNQICLTAMAEALRPEELTPLQYAVVAYLRDEPRVDQKGLAARLAVDRTNAGLLVDQLEKRGLVERLAHPDDRRVWQLRLTPLGDELFARLAPTIRAVQTNILERALTRAEADTLLSLLVRVIQANEQFARPGGGRRKRARMASRPSESPSPTSTRD